MLNIDVQGAAAVMRAVSRRHHDFRPPQFAGRNWSAVSAAAAPKARGHPAAASRRADYELELADRYGYQVINDDMDRAVEEICTILTQQWETQGG